MTATKNLGIVKALHVATTPPTNTDMIWRDTSLATPLHKYYNPTTLTWQAFIYAVLVDGVTIKINTSDQLYVDLTEIPALVIADRSIQLVKLQDIASGTVFYRKSAGNGSPEVQTLETLKTDLGLTGVNSGDQNLSLYVLKATTINSKPLSGNITLTPSDIGSPTGSGSSTGTNTGDETNSSILSKLGINSISGANTGDQTAETVPVVDEDGYFAGSSVEDILKELFLLVGNNKNVYEISLPSSTTVAGRISSAVEGTDYPIGWTLTPGVSPVDLLINHGLNRRVANVSIFAVTGTEEQQLFNTAAYNGIKTPTVDELLIQSLATINKVIKIYITIA